MIKSGKLDTFETVIINDLTDRQEVLSVLANTFDNEDFNGNNGEEYTLRGEAREQGLSDKDYVVSVLDNSGLIGEALIQSYLYQLYGTDNYYVDYDFNLVHVKDNTYVLSVVALIDD